MKFHFKHTANIAPNAFAELPGAPLCDRINNPMIKVVVFDFDGVIVDSNALKDRALFTLFADHPRVTEELVRDVYLHNVGTRFDILRDVFVRAGTPAGEIEQRVREYALRYDDMVQRGIAERGLAAGARETLEALSADRCLYVNSATAHEPLQATVERLGIRPYFRDVFGMPPAKEKNLQAILGREGVDPGEAVVIGDGEGDWRSARACGTRFIAVASGFHDWNIYEDGFPVISAIREAREALTKMS